VLPCLHKPGFKSQILLSEAKRKKSNKDLKIIQSLPIACSHVTPWKPDAHWHRKVLPTLVHLKIILHKNIQLDFNTYIPLFLHGDDEQGLTK